MIICGYLWSARYIQYKRCFVRSHGHCDLFQTGGTVGEQGGDLPAEASHQGGRSQGEAQENQQRSGIYSMVTGRIRILTTALDSNVPEKLPMHLNNKSHRLK